MYTEQFSVETLKTSINVNKCKQIIVILLSYFGFKSSNFGKLLTLDYGLFSAHFWLILSFDLAFLEMLLQLFTHSWHKWLIFWGLLYEILIDQHFEVQLVFLSKVSLTYKMSNLRVNEFSPILTLFIVYRVCLLWKPC